MKRHVGNRIGDTYIRYNSITKITARAGNLLTVPDPAVTTAFLAIGASASDPTVIPVPAGQKSRIDCRATL
jgi:hypothetical protein